MLNPRRFLLLATLVFAGACSTHVGIEGSSTLMVGTVAKIVIPPTQKLAEEVCLLGEAKNSLAIAEIGRRLRQSKPTESSVRATFTCGYE